MPHFDFTILFQEIAFFILQPYLVVYKRGTIRKRGVKMQRTDEIDIEVGKKLRILRKAKGLTQNELAEKIGITFQQFQKYENGTNRLSASRLYRTCQALDVDMNILFEGIPVSVKPLIANDSLSPNEVDQLVGLWQRIKNPSVRSSILILLKTIAEK